MSSLKITHPAFETRISIQGIARALAEEDNEAQAEFINVFCACLRIECTTESRLQMQLLDIAKGIDQTSIATLKGLINFFPND